MKKGKSSRSLRKTPRPGIQSLDFLGEKFSLNFSTTTGYFQTRVGGIITIILGIVSICTFIVVMSQYFDKTSPVVTNSTEFGSKITEFNLYQGQLYPVIGMFFLNKYISQNHARYLTIRAKVVTSIFDSKQHKYDYKLHKAFDYIPCNQIQDQTIIDYVKQLNNNEGFIDMLLCPDFKGEANEFSMVDNYVDYTFRWVMVEVYPCSLEDKTQCASAAEMKHMALHYGHL